MPYREEQPQRREEVLDPDRRRFLQAGLGAAGAIVAASSFARTETAASLLPLDMTTTGPEDIPRKPLGRTGEHVSILGLGGDHPRPIGSPTEGRPLVPQTGDAGGTFLPNPPEDKPRGRGEE